MKKLIIVIAILSIVIVSCNVEQKTTSAATDYFEAEYFSDDFLAYQNFKDNLNTRSIGEEINPFDYLYTITFNSTLTLDEAISFIQENDVAVTHINYVIEEEGIIGGVAAYNSYFTTKDEIDSIYEEENNVKLSDLNTEITSLYAVILLEDDLNTIKDLETVKSIISYSEVVSEEESNINSKEATSRSVVPFECEPDNHSFSAFTVKRTYFLWFKKTYCRFQWDGYWANPAKLEALHEGDSPAFEPDLTMHFDINMLGLPCVGWSKPDPRSNARTWGTNFPDPYLDTQACDFIDRAFTVGTTSAEKMVLNKTYYFYIEMPKWNSDEPIHREIEYELEHWEKSGIVEGNPWSVGVLWNDTKSSQVFFEFNSDYIVPGGANF